MNHTAKLVDLVVVERVVPSVVLGQRIGRVLRRLVAQHRHRAPVAVRPRRSRLVRRRRRAARPAADERQRSDDEREEDERSEQREERVVFVV